jgi:hypothetical protein
MENKTSRMVNLKGRQWRLINGFATTCKEFIHHQKKDLMFLKFDRRTFVFFQ